MSDSIDNLTRANEFESQKDFLAAAALCEASLDGSELPDHYFTLARNYFNLACSGNEIYAWKALVAALEGVKRRLQEQGQADAEYAVDITRWVLDYFSDWHRNDVLSSYREAHKKDGERGVAPDTTMRSRYAQYAALVHAANPVDVADNLLREAPPVMRHGRSQESVGRELRFLLGNYFSQLPNCGVAELLSDIDFPLPGDYDCQQYDKFLFTASKAELHRLQARARGVPTIFLSCMPKAASEFLCSTLGDTLNAPIVRITMGDPVRGIVNVQWIAKAVGGGCVLHDHFNARPENLRTIWDGGVRKVSVLVRDPRAVAWSLRNMAIEFGDKGINAEHTGEFPIVTLSFSQWIQTWIIAAANGLDVEFIRFKDLVSSPDKVMGKILDRFDGQAFHQRLLDVLATRGKGNNFRQGNDNAWREHVSAQTADLAWANIPHDVRELLDLRQ